MHNARKIIFVVLVGWQTTQAALAVLEWPPGLEAQAELRDDPDADRSVLYRSAMTPSLLKTGQHELAFSGNFLFPGIGYHYGLSPDWEIGAQSLVSNIGLHLRHRMFQRASFQTTWISFSSVNRRGFSSDPRLGTKLDFAFLTVNAISTDYRLGETLLLRFGGFHRLEYVTVKLLYDDGVRPEHHNYHSNLTSFLGVDWMVSRQVVLVGKLFLPISVEEFKQTKKRNFNIRGDKLTDEIGLSLGPVGEVPVIVELGTQIAITDLDLQFSVGRVNQYSSTAYKVSMGVIWTWN